MNTTIDESVIKEKEFADAVLVKFASLTKEFEELNDLITKYKKEELRDGYAIAPYLFISDSDYLVTEVVLPNLEIEDDEEYEDLQEKFLEVYEVLDEQREKMITTMGKLGWSTSSFHC